VLLAILLLVNRELEFRDRQEFEQGSTKWQKYIRSLPGCLHEGNISVSLLCLPFPSLSTPNPSVALSADALPAFHAARQDPFTTRIPNPKHCWRTASAPSPAYFRIYAGRSYFLLCCSPCSETIPCHHLQEASFKPRQTSSRGGLLQKGAVCRWDTDSQSASQKVYQLQKVSLVQSLF